MRILVVITGLGTGGAERLVSGLCDRFASKGHKVMLVALAGPVEMRPSDERVGIANLEMKRSPLGVFRSLWRMRQIIRQFRPDIVNSHLVHANILTRLLRLVTPMPRLVSSAHNTNEGGRGRMIAYRLTDGLADISTNVSEEAVEAFERQGALRPGRMIAIHNGIDTAAFAFDTDARGRVRSELALEATTPLLLAVGRLGEQKDYPNLLQAFARLPSKSALPLLLIVGDGPLHGELLRLAASLDISERVVFLGVRHDVSELMSACDLYVMSSAWEGLPMVILEAMACQRPIVATDCGGIKTVLNGTGVVVPTQDSEALSQGMERVLCLTSEEREAMGRAARQRVVETYSLDATATQYLSIYEAGQPKTG